MTKISKFIDALSKGQTVTYGQMMKRFGYVSRNSASGRVTDLRNAGVDIVRYTHKSKPTRYGLYSSKSALEKQGFKVSA